MPLLRAAAHGSTGRDRDRAMLDFASAPRDPVSNSASPRHHVPAQARDRGAAIKRRVPMKRIPSKQFLKALPYRTITGAHAAIRHYGDAAAAFASASSAAAMALTAASTSWPSPCRFASQPGSLYESHV